MKLYQVSSIKRCVYAGNKSLPLKVKCLSVDDVGMFVYYNKERQFEPEYLKKYKPVLKRKIYFIEADDFRDAIVRFFIENHSTEIGGNSIESRALSIDRKAMIVELPFCPLMHKNMYGEFICGAPHICGGKEGDIGMCTIENYMPPKDCTFVSFQLRLIKDYAKYQKIAKRVLGFKVIKSNQVQPAEFPSMFPEENLYL